LPFDDGASGLLPYVVNRFRTAVVGGAWLMAAACTRTSAPPAGKPDGPVEQDVKDVAKATKKAAKDIGHTTVDLANKAGEGGKDAWLTTKVKTALTSDGFDPVHVHVDTDDHVVTLSGTVDSAKDGARAVAAARAVEGVADVKDHLFVKPR